MLVQYSGVGRILMVQPFLKALIVMVQNRDLQIVFTVNMGILSALETNIYMLVFIVQVNLILLWVTIFVASKCITAYFDESRGYPSYTFPA